MQRFDTSDFEHDACGVGFIYRPQASKQVIEDALTALCNLEHRGALAADGASGDGAGILAAIPWRILENEGWPIFKIRAVGMVFFPVDVIEKCRQVANDFISEQGFELIGWRRVPVDRHVLGPDAERTCPDIELMLLGAPEDLSDEEIERKLLVARKLLIHKIYCMPDCSEFYIASLSTSTIVYKAMVKSQSLAPFYCDLRNDLFESSWAVFHRRFSTNTNPKWRLAQPFRMIGHNGEINTLSGNRNWLHAREMVMNDPLFSDRRDVLRPLVHPLGSDSANLDNLFELFVRAGLSPQEAMMRLIPEAHSAACHLADDDIAAFYEYHAALQEPWDGPALIVYSDGKFLGASLDRNGLRPARYTVLKDGSVLLCSETGVLDLPVDEIVAKGRLGPGQMIVVEIETGLFHSNEAIKTTVSKKHPYSEWLEQERIVLEASSSYEASSNARSDYYQQKMSADSLLARQIAAGYGEEDIEQIIDVMAQTGHEPIFSMGDDTALPILSRQPRSFFDYFRQRFAQVTNPPIDHLREELVFSLDCYLGKKSTSLHPGRQAARVLKISSPVLTEAQLDEIKLLEKNKFAARVSLLLDISTCNLRLGLNAICKNAAASVNDGCQVLILSDREGSNDTFAVPVLLAVGAVHNYLIEQGLRMSTSIVVETSQVWSTHQLACLLGFGAEAICPYLAYETIRHRIIKSGIADLNPVQHLDQLEHLEQLRTGLNNYVTASNSGLLKILSKMGVSVLASYVGAQIFECIGVSKEVIELCFPGTQTHLPALTFKDIENETLRFHACAYAQSPVQLTNRGFLRNRSNGEFHGNNPELVSTLHKALGYRNLKSAEQDRLNEFLNYASLTRRHEPSSVRDLLTFISDRKPISLQEVEPAEHIVRRFCSGGMSLGALSPESHTSLAIAMNRLGAKSNSGEGGEDPERYKNNMKVNADGTCDKFPGISGLKEGDCAASAIRQVASARFGVTPEYLVTARQLEIKMAQGAKPGEGGQLPGAKVSEYIAKLRCADAGTTLISPPTHHDIYSIEDLAQLIFDLKQVNPRAAISVKLVSESGIGTIAAGVAKAKADIIQISGHDGGTGASALSSIKHAGIPWELGLAEVQRVLLSTGLRQRVLLRVDGGLRSSWDIIIAALLGAEEFGFASIALIAQGCIMARVCHTNNCPVGITSQKESLRKKFPGLPEKVVEFFLFLAEDVRYMLAELGYRSLSELTGRVDLLQARAGVSFPKSESIDLSTMLTIPPLDHKTWKSNTEIQPKEKTLDDDILADIAVPVAIRNHGQIEKELRITNRDRAVGARISGEIASLHGNHGFNGNISIKFAGAAGQSFGAFLVSNVRLHLTGECNDYVGKGMCGGEIVVRPNHGAGWINAQNTIVGNACLYGATGGALFAAGQAGERFAVRNSRAIAVIEGTGDHCCEYMTGGWVVVLGSAGRNFGAGMTGGVAYVLDLQGTFPQRCNIDSGMELMKVTDESAIELLQLIHHHYALTGSARAKEIIDDWADYVHRFWEISRKVSLLDKTASTRSTYMARGLEIYVPEPVPRRSDANVDR